MNYQNTSYPEMENVGLIDGAVRGSLSMAILVSVLLLPSMPSTMLIGLTLAAIYTGLTAFIGWDPVYAWVKKPQPLPQTPVSATVAVHPRSAEQAFVGGHKKAA
jgi:hypothetical protein